jgi:hypothetical protein
MNKHNDRTTIRDARALRITVQEALARQALGLLLSADQKRALLKYKTLRAVGSNYAKN